MSKLWRAVRDESGGLHLRLLLVQLLLGSLPFYVGSRLRVYGLRLAGFQIGHGCVMWGMPSITGGPDLYRNLRIGQGCWFNVGCFFDLGAPITIGDRVAFGHQVLVMTNSHDIGTQQQRAAGLYAKPVTIGDGVWLGARCTILPGVTIGAGAIVAAGAMVNRDVAPNTLVAGVPACVIKLLP